MSGHVTFFVAGVPRTKGSVKAFVVGKRAIVTNMNTKTKPWQMAVTIKARAAGVPKSVGPVDLVLAFYFRRPACHYGTGRNATTMKTNAPRRPTSHVLGDLDKIVRPILDALTGVAYVDDSQVVGISAVKHYAGAEFEPGVQVTVAESNS